MAQPGCDVLENGSNNVPTKRNIQIIYASASSPESQHIEHQTSELAQETACIICITAAALYQYVELSYYILQLYDVFMMHDDVFMIVFFF